MCVFLLCARHHNERLYLNCFEQLTGFKEISGTDREEVKGPATFDYLVHCNLI